MKYRSAILKGTVIMLAVGLLALPLPGYAQERSREHREDGRSFHHQERHEASVFRLPRNYVSLSIGGLSLFYGDGHFYRRSGVDYVVVQPPFGAVVSYIPGQCEIISVNGANYYVYEGLYYRHVPNGYVLVEPPADVFYRSVGPGTFRVSIPNYWGGYTKVLIRRSGDGFIGPRGEYYSDFPTLGQLQAMYCRR